MRPIRRGFSFFFFDGIYVIPCFRGDECRAASDVTVRAGDRKAVFFCFSGFLPPRSGERKSMLSVHANSRLVSMRSACVLDGISCGVEAVMGAYFGL